MFKNNKWRLVLSSVIILLPMVLGLIMWNNLPEQMSTHWGADGKTDGVMGKSMAVFGLPLILLALHWLGLFFTERDNKNVGQSKKVIGMVFWIVPVISVFSNGVIYLAASGKEFGMSGIVSVMLGLGFILVGNYMPKCKQNYTIGLKIKWTLEDEENWNATHRFAGKLWVCGGLVILFCAFLPEMMGMYVVFALMIPLAVAPIVYSYLFYKKQVKSGKTPEKAEFMPEVSTKYKVVSTVICIVVLLVILFWVFFAAKFEVVLGESSFTVEASGWSDLTVEYNAIDSVEYRDDIDIGVRTSGFGSVTLSMGLFKNDEFGAYTVFAYNSARECVVVTSGEKKLVIAYRNREETKNFYDGLMEMIAEK